MTTSSKLAFGALSLLLFFVAETAQGDALRGSYKNHFTGRWVGGTQGATKYRMFAPSKVTRKTSLPIVIYLHGSAKVGTDNRIQTKVAVPVSIMNNMKIRPCILVAPQCAPRTSWMGSTGNDVIALIEDILKEVPIADKKRVYLIGFSLGAIGTWHLLDLRPDLFAAAVPLAGTGNPAKAARMKGIDIWIFHGRRDKNVPVKYARTMSAALKKEGASVKYTELVASHFITSKVFNKPDVHEWLFAQKRD